MEAVHSAQRTYPRRRFIHLCFLFFHSTLQHVQDKKFGGSGTFFPLSPPALSREDFSQWRSGMDIETLPTSFF